MRLAIIRALGLEEPLTRLSAWTDRQLQRWPWLYRRLGG
jgi:hypothetical protein